MNAYSDVSKTILVADDGSDFARAAIEFVGRLLKPETCSVFVLRTFSSQQATELGALEDALAHTCEYFRSRGFQVDSELILGSPAQTIIEYAERKKVDLIAMGAKGLRATLGILLGGVAQQVVEYASCPVLVVRPGHEEAHRVLLLTDGSPAGELIFAYYGRFPFPKEADVRVMHVLPP
ncbi:MAG: universal stress protein, partial [Anaerolineales bacterium]|nr:universal stress protein [Anaerolineales bacterium]